MIRRFASLAIMITAAVPASAQVSLPGPAQAPQAQRRFETPTPTPRPAAPDELPSPPPAVSAPAGAETVRFVLRDVSFTGLTAYRPDDLAPLFTSLIGQEISLADLYQLAGRITDKYREDGYLLSVALVPEQQVDGGRVTIQVVEGYVDQVSFTGPIAGPEGLPKGFADQIRASRPLKASALERYALLIGDLPGVNAQSVLKPSATSFGAADLEVVMQQTPWEGFISFDNQGSRYIGPYAVSGGISAYSRLGLYEQIDLTFAADPFDDTMYFVQGALTVPLHSAGSLAGDTLQIAGLYSLTKPDLPDRVFPFKTKGENVEGRLTYFVPVIRSRDQNLSTRFSFIWRDLENRITDLPNDERNPAREHVRVLQPRLTYDFVDGLNGISIIDLSANIGLDIFGASDRSDPRLVRQNADGQFIYLTGMLARLQPVARHLSLYGRVDFQVSNDPLPTTERFGVGGPQIGTGYAPGTLTGDDGIAGRIEARYGFDTDSNFVSGLQIYAHADYGWVHDQQVSGDDSEDLATVGAGVRFNLFKSLAFNPEIAQQISGRPGDCLNCKHETRFLFNVTQRF